MVYVLGLGFKAEGAGFRVTVPTNNIKNNSDNNNNQE